MPHAYMRMPAPGPTKLRGPHQFWLLCWHERRGCAEELTWSSSMSWACGVHTGRRRTHRGLESAHQAHVFHSLSYQHVAMMACQDPATDCPVRHTRCHTTHVVPRTHHGAGGGHGAGPGDVGQRAALKVQRHPLAQAPHHSGPAHRRHALQRSAGRGVCAVSVQAGTCGACGAFGESAVTVRCAQRVRQPARRRARLV